MNDTKPEHSSPPPPDAHTLKQNISFYFTLLLIMMVACLPGLLCSLYYLSTVPDVTWERGQDDLTYDRVWMVRQRRPIGVAHEAQRIQETISDDEVCISRTIRYFLWQDIDQDEAINSRLTQQLVKTDNGWQATGQSCS